VSLAFRELKVLRAYATMRTHVGQANAVVTVSVEIGPGDPLEAELRANIRGGYGRWVEIGMDITDDDRSELAAELKRIFRTGV